MEKIKTLINEEIVQMEQYQQSSAHSNNVIKEIRDALIELLLKLQEIDEYICDSKGKMKPEEYNEETLQNITNDTILQLLEEKLKLGMMTCGQFAVEEVDSGVSDDEILTTPKIDELTVPIPTPSSATTYIVDDKEKPLPFPSCYYNLMSGRATTTQVSSASPGQATQIGKCLLITFIIYMFLLIIFSEFIINLQLLLMMKEMYRRVSI